MMQPHLREQIERFTRESFPDGIAGYGTDSLRFTFYSLASTGRDIKFDIGRMEGFRNFCNKIWNAARYTLMNTEGKPVAAEIIAADCTPADRWIMDRFESAAEEIRQAMEQYRFDNASRCLYEFTWNEFCDWYVELSKPILWNEDENPAAAAACRRVLLTVLERTLRLLHPFLPFITEEIWQRIAPLLEIEGASIMMQPYPEPSGKAPDLQAAADIEWLKQIATAIRNIRGEMDISPARQIAVLLRCEQPEEEAAGRARLAQYRRYLAQLAKLESIEWLEGEGRAPAAATSIQDGAEVLVPLAGLIDVDAEKSRLDREIDKLEKGLRSVQAKLGNPGFVANAPEQVVAQVREARDPHVHFDGGAAGETVESRRNDGLSGEGIQPRNPAGMLNAISSLTPATSSTRQSLRWFRNFTTSRTSNSGAEAPAVTPMRVLPSSQCGSMAAALSIRWASQPRRSARSRRRLELELLAAPTTSIRSHSSAICLTASWRF